jgi:hypothetical protein
MGFMRRRLVLEENFGICIIGSNSILETRPISAVLLRVSRKWCMTQYLFILGLSRAASTSVMRGRWNTSKSLLIDISVGHLGALMTYTSILAVPKKFLAEVL